MIDGKWRICGVAAGLFVALAIAWGQDEPAKRTRGAPRARRELTEEEKARREQAQRERQEQAERQRRMRHLSRFRDLIKAAGLTEAQQDKLAKLAADQDTEMAELRTEHEEQVMGLLTAQQREAWQLDRKARPIIGRYANLKLTDQQKATITQMVKDAKLPDPEPGRGRRRGGYSREYYEAYNKLHELIVSGVLTAEQRETFQMAAKMSAVLGRLWRVGLTAEQRKKVAEMVKAADLPAAPRGREAYEPYRKLQEKVAAEVLTPEQREKLEARQSRGRGGRTGAERRPQPRERDKPKPARKDAPAIVK